MPLFILLVPFWMLMIPGEESFRFSTLNALLISGVGD